MWTHIIWDWYVCIVIFFFFFNHYKCNRVRPHEQEGNRFPYNISCTEPYYEPLDVYGALPHIASDFIWKLWHASLDVILSRFSPLKVKLGNIVPYDGTMQLHTAYRTTWNYSVTLGCVHIIIFLCISQFFCLYRETSSPFIVTLILVIIFFIFGFSLPLF